MIEIFKQITFNELLLLALGINVILFLLSVTLFSFFSKISKSQNLQNRPQTLTKEDIMLSILVIGCNALIFIIGFMLWQKDIVLVIEHTNIFLVGLEVIFLVFIMDLLMYIFHRIAHFSFFYRLVHLIHHKHESTNVISLFVLHPIEALGFGFLIILVIFVYPFSYLAISLYLFINLLWGTIGHLDKEILPKHFAGLKPGLLGTTRFHNDHHKHPHYNYGFYTVIWDKIFGTYRPADSENV
ncbi:sterol desaturase family protein [Pedobacter sp. ASV1-7]|uniref:sterol desaturase family protein n=1 Tax=Pedobacter sp. ASV1-7 TaxID=3145237 RepID=UPI0032E8D4AC